MLRYGQAGHGKQVVIRNLLSVLGDLVQPIALAGFPDLHGNAAEHRQGATVKGNEAPLVALHEVFDRLFQLRPGHGGAVGQETVWHDHTGCHFFRIIRVQHTAREAVSRGDQHICSVNPPQGVGHNRIGRIPPTGMEAVGIGCLRMQHRALRWGSPGQQLSVEGLVGLPRIVLP